MATALAITPERLERHSELIGDRKAISDKDRNHVVRQALAAAFPTTKFRVLAGWRAHTSVRWTDGPSERQVLDVAEPAVEGTCDIYGEKSGVETVRDYSLATVLAALVKSYETGTWFRYPNGQVKFDGLGDLYKLEHPEHTDDELALYAAISCFAGISAEQYSSLCAMDRKRSRMSGLGPWATEARRAFAEVIWTSGDAIKHATSATHG